MAAGAPDRNLALRDFLRARRAETTPAEAGVVGSGQRRVPGLRREEVAMLAGVSVDYYVRLEQGRDLSPSSSVLDALARVLRLSTAQRAQLYVLTRGEGPGAPAAETGGDDGVRPSTISLVHALEIPAILVGRGTEVLASNLLHRRLTTDFGVRPPAQRFYAHWLFLDPAARSLLGDWEHSAAETVGVLRAAVTRHPDDARLAGLVAALSNGSDEFRARWARNDVEDPSAGPKTYHHPEVGDLVLLHEVAQMSAEHWMHLYWVDGEHDDGAAAAALERLRSG